MIRTDPNPPYVPTLDLNEVDRIIVYGGDGTIHRALPQILSAGKPLAVLPGGTANVLAREIGIPLDLGPAADVATGETTRHAHLGLADGRYFLLMAGVGIDAEIVANVGRRLKSMLGTGAYWLAGLAGFWSHPFKTFEVSIDGAPETGTFLVVSNSRYYGGSLLLTPDASIFDDHLHVCLFQTQSPLRFLRYLVAVPWGNHISFPDVVYRKAKVVELIGAEGIRVQLDGELAGRSANRFSLAGETIELVVPKTPLV